ncbi:MAG: amino acid transport protein [Planctomycetota bacterium]|nr:amino acid transport protein [Planctomycetota bacterium]
MNQLLCGFIFGILGMAYVAYGKKQRRIVPLVAGFALIAFPYFSDHLAVLIGLGLLLASLPFWPPLRGL